MSKSNKSRRFHIESLEARQLMAADVAVAADALAVNEPIVGPANGADQVAVASAAAGEQAAYRPATKAAPMTTGLTPKNLQVSGNVVAFLNKGRLEIFEPNSEYSTANAIRIVKLPNGNIRIEGMTNAAGGVTRIIGPFEGLRDSMELPGAGDVIINLGGGSDTVHILDGHTFGSLYIDTSSYTETGEGDADSVYVGNLVTMFGVTIKTGSGADEVSLANPNVGALGFPNTPYHVDIQTGTGLDQVFVYGARMTGDLKIKTFAGDEFETGLLNERVRVFNTTVGRDLFADLGNGNDITEMTNVYAGRDIMIQNGAGDDIETLNTVEAADYFYNFLGQGNDIFSATWVRARSLQAYGGPGYDVANLPGLSLNNYDRYTAFDSFEKVNRPIYRINL